MRRFITPVLLTISLFSFGYVLATQSKEVEPIKASKDPIITDAGDIACAPTSPNYNRGNGTADTCHMG